MNEKMRRLVKNPFEILEGRVRSYIEKRRYENQYIRNPEGFWGGRLKRFGRAFQGVGNISLSEIENRKIYEEAGETFLALCRREKIEFSKVRMLDIGCGNGYYAHLFRQNGGRHYLGIDITDALFKELAEEFPGFRFEKLDISREQLQETCDLIVMLDVTQHIVTEDGFSFAMQNVRNHLEDRGVFIVTSWLSDRGRISFYEIARPLSAYLKEFPDYVVSQPLPFRDKFIFSIKRQEGGKG